MNGAKKYLAARMVNTFCPEDIVEQVEHDLLKENMGCN